MQMALSSQGAGNGADCDEYIQGERVVADDSAIEADEG
jgi:hypothetical protein